MTHRILKRYDWGTGGPFSCSGDHEVYQAFEAQGDFEMKVRSIAMALYSAFSIATTIALWVIIADTTATEFKKAGA